MHGQDVGDLAATSIDPLIDLAQFIACAGLVDDPNPTEYIEWRKAGT